MERTDTVTRCCVFVILIMSCCGVPAAAFDHHPRIRTVTLTSAALNRTLPLTIVEPKREEAASSVSTREQIPVLYVLHGRGRHHASLIEDEVTRGVLLDTPFYVVLPQGLDGWYINSPVVDEDRYETYIEEVIAWVEAHVPVRRDAAGRGIAGWSMGGYGAVRFAQSHPGGFAFVASVIGLLDFPREEILPEGQNYKVPTERFGTDPVTWKAMNPLYSIDQLRESAVTLVLSETGFERTMNERFIDAAAMIDLPLRVHRLSGGHEFNVVHRAVPLVLNDAARAFRRR
jgi:S-formylglutathione hydrolase FrmB